MVDISLGYGSAAVGGWGGLSARRTRALLFAAGRLDSLLRQNNQALRISVSGWSVLLGTEGSSVTVPELNFYSYRECHRAVKQCRLYDFAAPFFRGRIQVSGPLDALIDILYRINISNDTPQSIEEKVFFATFRKLKEWAPLYAQKFESNFHYSLDAEAYKLFLDPYLQYTCGRVGVRTRSIDDAQIEKFNLIADWVSERLGPLKGKRHLDIGCGWGGLISYFRNVYGAESVGITNCATQSKYISDQYNIKPIMGDFTRITELKEEFDFVTVIGMSEHVVGGLKDKLLEVIRGSLKDGGVVYFQTIAKPDQWIGGDAYRIAQEIVFPGHDLDRQSEAELRFVRAGFEIVHAEDHTADYAYTTGEWAKRVHKNFDKLSNLVGPKDAGLFLMYLLYASKLFKVGRGKLLRYALVKKQ